MRTLLVALLLAAGLTTFAGGRAARRRCDLELRVQRAAERIARRAEYQIERRLPKLERRTNERCGRLRDRLEQAARRLFRD